MQASGWLKRLGLGDSQRLLFVLHVALLVLGLAVVQPLNGFLAFRAWRWFLSLSALLQGYKVGASTADLHFSTSVNNSCHFTLC